MIVHQETNIAGKPIFHPYECSYCRMNTAGNHEHNCPAREENKNVFVPDPIEDYNDPTEYY